MRENEKWYPSTSTNTNTNANTTLILTNTNTMLTNIQTFLHYSGTILLLIEINTIKPLQGVNTILRPKI